VLLLSKVLKKLCQLVTRSSIFQGVAAGILCWSGIGYVLTYGKLFSSRCRIIAVHCFTWNKNKKSVEKFPHSRTKEGTAAPNFPIAGYGCLLYSCCSSGRVA